MVEIRERAQGTFVIHNSFSGLHDKSREVGEATDLLASKTNNRVDLRKTEGPGHATELAMEAVRAGYLHIVVAGGDGTFREVAAGAVNSDADVTLWPIGSEEIGRRDLKMPKNLLQAVDIVINGKTQLIDTGSLNGECFIFNAGIGADAEVVYGVQKPGLKKDAHGVMAYVSQAVRILPTVRGVAAKLTIDGEIIDGNLYQIWVNNGRRLARFPITKGNIDDGEFEVLLGFADKLSQLVFPAIANLISGRNSNQCMQVVASNIEIDLDKPRKAQVDGDPLKQSDHFLILTHPRSLRIKVPDRENTIYSKPAILR